MEKKDKFCNVEAEKILINQMILDGSIIPNVYDTLKPECFSTQSYRKCYEAIITLARQCTPIDELSFRTAVKGYILPEIVDEVTNATFTASNWEYYATEIKTCYTARAVRVLLEESLQKLSAKNGADIANELMRESAKIAQNISACETHEMSELVKVFVENLDSAVTQKKQFTGIPCGLSQIDDIVLGIQPEYIIIGARPSLGKTALGEQIALTTAGAFGGEKKRTLFVELEMSPKQLVERAVANIAKVSISKLKTGMLQTNQFLKVAHEAQKLAEIDNFVPVTCNTRKWNDISACIRREVRVNGAEIVFIDHIGLVVPTGSYKNSWEGVAEISHGIQMLQRELGIPIIVLSQVGRGTEGKKASLADLRGSGAIEEDADQVWLIDRDRQNDPNEIEIPANVAITKNRNGACGEAHLIFHPKEVMFSDAPRESYDKNYAEEKSYSEGNRSVAHMIEDAGAEFLSGGIPFEL